MIFLFSFWATVYKLLSSIDPIFGLITLLFGGGIYLWKTISTFLLGTPVIQSYPIPQFTEITQKIESLGKKYSLPSLPVYIYESQDANIVLRGLGPIFNRLFISRGILPYLQDGGLRADAILLHEMAHFATWDVLIFTLGYYPVLLTKLIIGILLWIPGLLIRNVGSVLKGGVMSTFFLGRSCFGFFIILISVIFIISIFFYIGYFVIFGILFVIISVVPFCTFLRNRELSADQIAVQWLGKPQPVVLALCQTLESQPIDKHLASLMVGGLDSADPKFIPNLINTLKTNRLSLPGDYRWKAFFRTHPYVIQRIQRILFTYPGEFA